MRMMIASVVALPLTWSTAVDARRQLALGRLTGTVTSVGLGDALPGTSVLAFRVGEGVSARTETDRHGRFALEGLPAGAYSVDFDFPMFDIVRRNNVVVGSGATAPDLSVQLRVSTICECITYSGSPASRFVMVPGRLIDGTGRPLAHALLEIKGGPPRPNTGFSGLDGEFVARLPVGAKCALVVTHAGFGTTTRDLTVSGTNAEITIQLASKAAATLPELEAFGRGCRCPDSLFAHRGW
jgi:hypothetical protein